MAAERRRQLTEAVAAQDADRFRELVANHKSRANHFNLDEVLTELTRTQLEELWDHLLCWVSLVLDTLIPDDDDVESDKVDLLNGVLDAATSTIVGLKLGEDKAATPPAGLLQVTVICNAMLISLYELPALDSLSGRVCRLSELWWKRQLPGADTLAPTALIYLLQLLVSPDHKTSLLLVKRVQALWPCVRQLNLSAPSSARLRQLLVGAAQCVHVLAWEQGARLVSELISSPPLRSAVHEAIKAVLPSATISQARRYGQAYYGAWKHVDAANKKSIEEICIQDLMFHAVHVGRHRSRLPRLLLELLHHFHEQKTHRETSTMLAELYQPILWRALSAPNITVQLNATFLFMDVFPLDDLAESRDTRDLQLARQCQIVSDLLAETSHDVRAAAVKGTCRALLHYWDMIPAQSLKAWIQQLLKVLAFDAAAANVRHDVITGVTLILDNPLSHTYMKSALPFLLDAFHDVQLGVRIAMCDLLLKVKAIKSVRYFDIVPVKHLLARLAIDEKPVCKRLVQLIGNSFFPASESDETLLTRCIFLIEQNREASRRFYSHSQEAISLTEVVRLMMVIHQALLVHAQRQQRLAAAAASPAPSSAGSSRHRHHKGGRPGKRRLHNVEDRSVLSESSQDGGSSDDDSLRSDVTQTSASATAATSVVSASVLAGSPLEKAEVLCGLVDVVVVLWTARATELVADVTSTEKLAAAWSKSLHLMFTMNKNSPAGDSLLYLASLLPHSPMAALASHCISALRRLSDDAPRARYAALLDPLVNWGRCDDVIELCADCLVAAVDGEKSFVASKKNQRRSVAGVRFREPQRAASRPRLALRMLMHIFGPSMRRSTLVTKYGTALTELQAWMSARVVGVCEQRLSSERPDEDGDGLVEELLETYGVLSLALAAADSSAHAVVAGLRDVLEWAHGVTSTPDRWAHAALLRRVVRVLQQTALETSATGVLQPELAAAAAQLLQLQLGLPSVDMDTCVSVLLHGADLLEAATLPPPEADAQPAPMVAICVEVVPGLAGAAIGQLTNLAASGDEPTPTQLSQLTGGVRALLAGWRRLGADGGGCLTDVAALLLTAACVQMGRDKLVGSAESPQPDLPPLTAALLKPLRADPLGRRLLLGCMQSVLAPSDAAAVDTSATSGDSTAAENMDQLVTQTVTCAYILHWIPASDRDAADGLFWVAVSAALAAVGRINGEELQVADEAPLQHLSSAKRLLQELHVCHEAQA